MLKSVSPASIVMSMMVGAFPSATASSSVLVIVFPSCLFAERVDSPPTTACSGAVVFPVCLFAKRVVNRCFCVVVGGRGRSVGVGRGCWRFCVGLVGSVPFFLSFVVIGGGVGGRGVRGWCGFFGRVSISGGG